jgi:hypothetical protein
VFILKGVKVVCFDTLLQQDYSLDAGDEEGLSSTDVQPNDLFIGADDAVTIGIAVACQGGDYVILASDTRVSYNAGSGMRQHNYVCKQWDLPAPFRGAAAMAGKLWLAQPYCDEFHSELKKLAKQLSTEKIEVEHVENVVNHVRDRIHYRFCDWDMRCAYKISLGQWQRGDTPEGHLDPILFTAGERLIKETKFEAQMIWAGFIDSNLVWGKADQLNKLQVNIAPGYLAIGSGSKLAMNHLALRGQNIERGLPESLLNIYEALKKARQVPDKSVGIPSDYIVVHRERKDVGRFPANSQLLRMWAKTYKNRVNRSTLNQTIPTQQVKALMLIHKPTS